MSTAEFPALPGPSPTPKLLNLGPVGPSRLLRIPSRFAEKAVCTRSGVREKAQVVFAAFRDSLRSHGRGFLALRLMPDPRIGVPKSTIETIVFESPGGETFPQNRGQNDSMRSTVMPVGQRPLSAFSWKPFGRSDRDGPEAVDDRHVPVRALGVGRHLLF